MNKKIGYTALIATVITLAATSFFYFYKNWNINSKNSKTSFENKNEILSEENNEKKSIFPNNFILIPENYDFNEKENSFVESLEDTFSIITVTSTSLLLDGEEGQIIKDEDSQLIPQPQTANPTYYMWEIGLEESVFSSTQNINVVQLLCVEIDKACLNEYSRLASIYTDAYIYIPNAPLLSINRFREINYESNQTESAIILWENALKGMISQKYYSYELIDSNSQRFFASGKIESTNIGDFFFPLSEMKDNKYTIKVRIWIEYNKIKSTNPIILSSEYVPKSGKEIIKVDLISQDNNSSIIQMAWIPDWGMTAGITSVRKSPSKWHTISPVWFWPNKDGTLRKEVNYNNTILTNLLKQNKIRLIPTITLFDPDILNTILNKNMDKHISIIVKEVKNNNYAGIDLDYESTYETDTELLYEFLTKLKAELGKDKVLSFTVLPKIDDRRIYSFLPQTHQAQDWEKIGSIVDEFRIMAYDFTGQGSIRPGPLSPYNWNEELLIYATSKMPAEKIILALPIYSHAWQTPTNNTPEGIDNDKSLSSDKLKNTYSWQHDDIAYVKSHSSYYKETYDNWNKEIKADMMYNGVRRTMYYLDKKAVKERIELAERYGIKGICYWRIGGESL